LKEKIKLMKSNFVNETHIEGVLYDQKLQKKVTGESSKHPGTEFITGTVSIATDDKMENVIQVHYTYITAVTSKGNADARFATLDKIMTENQSVLNVGNCALSLIMAAYRNLVVCCFYTDCRS